LKKRVLAELDAVAPERVIIASNSSSYSCGEIIEGLTLKHQSRILSAHTCKSSMRVLSTLAANTNILIDWPPETAGKTCLLADMIFIRW
jgi:hypothetical protein